MEFPQYECHKKVRAAKIESATELVPGPWTAQGTKELKFEGHEPITVQPDFVAKHNPQAGDYLVVYEDGYMSVSPAEAFETGYTLMKEAKKEPEKKVEKSPEKKTEETPDEPEDSSKKEGSALKYYPGERGQVFKSKLDFSSKKR